MSPEIDQTRQRTVAELLAEHGDGAGAPRRRRRDGSPPPGPPVPPSGFGPGARRHPGPNGAPPRDTGRDLPPPGRLGAPPAPPGGTGSVPPGARRDRPTEMIADHRARAGYAAPQGFRDGVRPRSAPPVESPNGRPPAAGSGPMRAVPPAPPSGPRGTPPALGSGPMRAVPPAAPPARETPRAMGSGPVRAVPPAAPPARETPRGAAYGTGRPTMAPRTAREQAAPVAPPRATPPQQVPGHGPSVRGAGPWPVRDATGQRRGRAVPDPGPATGAFDPFADDDDHDQLGPATLVGRAGLDRPRRDQGAPPNGFRPRDPRFTGDVRRGPDGPATQFDVTRTRREAGEVDQGLPGSRAGDGPATVAGQRGAAVGPPIRRTTDGPETVAGRRADGPPPVAERRGDGPATVAGRGTGDGPATEVGANGARHGSGRRRAPGRTGFGFGLRGGRGGRDAPPAAALGAAPAAPSRPALRRPVDEPTELTGRDEVADRVDFDVAPRRDALFAPPTRDDRDADLDEHGPLGPDDDVDELVRGDHEGRLGDLDDDLDLDEPELDDELDDDAVPDDLQDELDDEDDEPVERPAQAWAGVVAQWLAGATAGAVLWVLFRYLWRGLPVVALAAALLVTAGLVLLVRQVLHDADRRTTAFAVLVGLLLTASPAVLVLLGR